MQSDTQPGAMDELRARIRSRGPITFAEFMDVALYWPHGGYYATRNAFGPGGDFYTAPLTHPVFGALLARQLWQVWQAMGAPRPFWVIEPGAGNGRLAADLVAHSRLLDDAFADALRYGAVEVRPPGDAPAVDRVRSDAMPFRGLRGVVLANELLDALPVHRVAIESGRLREVHVDVAEAAPEARSTHPLAPVRPAFREMLGEPSTPALAERLESLGVRLPEGYRTEVCLQVGPWLSKLAASLEAGYVLLIDYGHEANAYYAPERARGTLRCYYRHTLTANPYVHVGTQDIGAHVEFTSVMREAEAAGLTMAGFTMQADFLRRLGLDAYRASIDARGDVPAPVRATNLRAVDLLAAPEAMGPFKVLALRKGVPDVSLAGFEGDASGLPGADAPLATPAHMPLGGVEQPPAMPTWEELLR